MPPGARAHMKVHKPLPSTAPHAPAQCDSQHATAVHPAALEPVPGWLRCLPAPLPTSAAFLPPPPHPLQPFNAVQLPCCTTPAASATLPSRLLSALTPPQYRQLQQGAAGRRGRRRRPRRRCTPDRVLVTLVRAAQQHGTHTVEGLAASWAAASVPPSSSLCSCSVRCGWAVKAPPRPPPSAAQTGTLSLLTLVDTPPAETGCPRFTLLPRKLRMKAATFDGPGLKICLRELLC